MAKFWQLSAKERAVWPILVCLASMVALFAVGGTFLEWYRLDLGSLVVPRPRHTIFLFYWTLLGSFAAFCLVIGVTRFFCLRTPGSRPVANRVASRETTWIASAMGVAFMVPWAIRTFLLEGAVLTDDESAYRFMGEVLAGGRVWVASHPLRSFFDRVFMINDGKFYSTYFIGWPLLMVPGVYAGITGYMNAIYAALTVPALYAVARHLAGPGGGRIVTILYVASPMLMVAAATELSHTTCMMALAWSVYFLLRSGVEPDAWWTHSGVAFFFSLAFLVRPTSALGIGIPVLAWWTLAMVRWPSVTRRRAVVCFGVPAVLMAAVFLVVNTAQNGSPFLTSYIRMQQFMREVNYQNVGWTQEAPPASISRYILPSFSLGPAVAKTTVALVRLGFDLFGAPAVLLLVGFAWSRNRARLVWLSVCSFVIMHLFLQDAGVDSFGPVHYFELSLPLLLLCGIGSQRLAAVARARRPALPPSWPLAAVVSVIAVSLVGFVPVRLAALKVIADNVNSPAHAAGEAGLANAVVFSKGSFVDQHCIAPTRHFVFFRPNNDPEMKNDVLWVNDLGLERDRELMGYFPERIGYVMTWQDCRPRFQKF